MWPSTPTPAPPRSPRRPDDHRRRRRPSSASHGRYRTLPADRPPRRGSAPALRVPAAHAGAGAGHRGAGPGQRAGAPRRRHRLRHPRRGHPSGLRPAAWTRPRCGTSSCATSRAPGHAAEGMRRRPASRGLHGDRGPGATNLVTPMADAYMDSMPIVAITGQVRARRSAPTRSRRPTSGASRCRSRSTTSSSPTPAEIPRPLAEAFHIAATGRPGPVLVDISQGRAAGTKTSVGRRSSTCPGTARDPPAQQAGPRGGPADHRRQPARSYVGGGVIRSGARDELRPPGRADPDPGGHHADGARGVAGQHALQLRHAGDARDGRRSYGRCSSPTC